MESITSQEISAAVRPSAVCGAILFIPSTSHLAWLNPRIASTGEPYNWSTLSDIFMTNTQ